MLMEIAFTGSKGWLVRRRGSFAKEELISFGKLGLKGVLGCYEGVDVL